MEKLVRHLRCCAVRGGDVGRGWEVRLVCTCSAALPFYMAVTLTQEVYYDCGFCFLFETL